MHRRVTNSVQGLGTRLTHLPRTLGLPGHPFNSRMGSYLDSAITEQHEQGLISLDPLQQQGWGRHLYLFHAGQISTLGEQAGQVTRLA